MVTAPRAVEIGRGAHVVDGPVEREIDGHGGEGAPVVQEKFSGGEVQWTALGGGLVHGPDLGDLVMGPGEEGGVQRRRERKERTIHALTLSGRTVRFHTSDLLPVTR